VFDESVQYRRDEAKLAAGYFDIAWEPDESLGVFRSVTRTEIGSS
jgi:hypothetical protein